MRTILFRAKQITDGGWAFGLPFQMNHEYYIFQQPERNAGIRQIDPDTLGQFSGLQDIHGKPIFEGDILRNRGIKKCYVVKFWQGMFYASVEECNKDVFGGYPLHFFVNLIREEPGCEIVGNIFDNQEMVINRPTPSERAHAYEEERPFVPSKLGSFQGHVLSFFERLSMKDGEIYYVRARVISIMIYSARSDYKFLRAYVDYIPEGDSKGLYFESSYGVCFQKDVKKIRRATEKEKMMLFCALSERGLMWDAEKKEVIDLPQP